MTTELLTPSLERAADAAPQVQNRVTLDAPLLAHIRRVARGALRFPDWEDFSGEYVCRLLDEAKAAKAPNMVRKDHCSAAWIKLEARSYALRTLNPQSKELTGELDSPDSEDSPRGELANWRRPWDSGTPDMESEEFQSPEETPDEPEWNPVNVRQIAGRIVRHAHLHDEPITVFPIIQALSDVPVATIAKVWGMTPAAWSKAASKGAKRMREAYPRHADLAAALIAASKEVTTMGVVKRETPLAERRIGKALPKDVTERHRTPPQTYREADWLLAAPQLPGRKADAARASGSESRTGKRGDDLNAPPAVPEAWAHTRTVSLIIPPEWSEHFRRIARSFARQSANAGRQAGSYGEARIPSIPLTRGSVTVVTPPAPPETDAWSRVPYASPHFATYDERGRRTDTRRTSAESLPLGHGPKLPAWEPRVRRSPARTNARSLVGGTPAESAGRELTWSETWQLVFTPPKRRAYVRAMMMNQVSLDVATATEYRQECDKAFPMVADLIAAHAE